MYKFLPVLVLAATPASAEFVEGTLFPFWDNAEPVLSFEGPVETENGKRWTNVTLVGEEGGGVRLDWLDEVVSGDTTTLTFSDTGTFFRSNDGTEEIVATMRLTDAIWTIEDSADGLAHEANAETVRVIFSEPTGDPDGELTLSDLSAAVDVDYGESYVLQSIASVGQVALQLRDMEAAGDELNVTVSNIEMRQDSEVDVDLIDRLENAEEEFTSVEDVQAALSGVSNSRFGVGEMAIRYSSVENEVNSAELVTRDLQVQSALDLNGETLGFKLEGKTGTVGGSLVGAPATIIFEASDYDVDMSASIEREDLPELVEAMDAGGPEALAAFDLRYEIGIGETKAGGAFDQLGLTGSFDLVSGAATEVIAIEDGRLLFEVLSDGFDGTMSLSSLGDESFAASLDKFDVSVGLPLVPLDSDDADELQFVLRALNAVANAPVWAMFDAEGTIPRDPINIDVDVAGWGEMLAPLDEGSDFNEAFRLDGARINSFLLSGGGAEATATGETLIDLSTGVPVGDGAFSVSLKGVTDLIGKLANLGFVPPEANLGLRGILGAFARPVGEDHFVSEIELLPDGQILTNGVPLPLGR